MPLEELDSTLMFLRRFLCAKGPEIAPLARLRIFFP